jgi:hypothetical protein
LNKPCQRSTTHTKEENHGHEEEEGKEEIEVILKSVCEPRIGAAPSGALSSARSSDLAKRLNGVRPLLLLPNGLHGQA